MNLFSFLCDAWSTLAEDMTGNSSAPIVNIDGTPMFNEGIDIHGNVFGLTNVDSPIDVGRSIDVSASWANGGFNDPS